MFFERKPYKLYTHRDFHAMILFQQYLVYNNISTTQPAIYKGDCWFYVLRFYGFAFS